MKKQRLLKIGGARLKTTAGIVATIAAMVLFTTASSTSAQILLDRLRLPQGFRIQLFADNVPDARSLALGSNGVIFIGTRKAGKVYAVTDSNQDNIADQVITIASGLNMPNGVAYQNGHLYVAEVHQVLKFDHIDRRLESSGKPTVVNDSFPKKRHHGWKYIAFGPDGKLYIPVGAPCNICESSDPRFATIMRMEADGSQLEIFARGIRNTVGFDWHPRTRQLWFTNNGRDWMGDDLPPDTLHRVAEKNLHFGYPYCHAGKLPDPKFGHLQPCDQFAPPALDLPAHVAPLGMKFYTGAGFPPAFQNRLYIAEHGSWNRSEPVGYRITTVTTDNDGPPRYEVFVEGWLNDGRAWGRPVDLLVMPDGALLVSDDRAGAVYRITYQGEGN